MLFLALWKGAAILDINGIMQMISSVGFPIVACIYLALSYDKMRTAIEENTKTISNLEKMISTIINMNTEVIENGGE